MKFKLLLNLTIAIFAIVFIACDDNLDTIGSNIQPDGDDIAVYTDTVIITAKTVSLEDSVYARTAFGVLGEYVDPIFGTVKSDYLSELYCPENLSFRDKTTSIDSVHLSVIFESFVGDSISPIGVSAYRVTKSLEKNYFTNIKPTDYCDLKESLGQGLFSIRNSMLPDEGGLREFKLEVDNSVGQELYDEWERTDGKVFTNSDELRKFFKGIYVTTTFGSGSLININTTALQVYYSYTGRNLDNTADSTRIAMLRLPVTSEVIQMNRVQNSIPSNLFENGDTRTYLKSPAGVCTELTIPLKKIMEIAETKGEGKNNKLNSATFKLKGYTEEEEKTNISQSPHLLFINKDSIKTFFTNPNKIALSDNKTSFIMIRDGYYTTASTTNTYNFSYSNTTSVSNNIATLINHYADYYKDKTDIPDLKYLVIPISVAGQSVSSGYTSVYTFTNVYNQMYPTTAIFRTDKDNMKMPLIFSSYNTDRYK